MNQPQDPNHLIKRLLGPPGPELGCEACFEELDRYVERTLAAEDAEAAVPGMRAHLDGCVACGEDYEALLSLLGG